MPLNPAANVRAERLSNWFEDGLCLANSIRTHPRYRINALVTIRPAEYPPRKAELRA